MATIAIASWRAERANSQSPVTISLSHMVIKETSVVDARSPVYTLIIRHGGLFFNVPLEWRIIRAWRINRAWRIIRVYTVLLKSCAKITKMKSNLKLLLALSILF